MKIEKAKLRGNTNLGWLDSYHSFSFGQYHNPEKVGFGKLRVLNDDWVQAGAGFGTHQHKNMEIISIPLSGVMEHKDSEGNVATLEYGKIQVMSAGHGIYHSEFNKSQTDELRFFQIWIQPDTLNVEPRYDEYVFEDQLLRNQWNQILSPNKDDQGVWIHQKAWINLLDLEENQSVSYSKNLKENGIFMIVIEGTSKVNEVDLESRDSVSFETGDNMEIKAITNSKILVIEVPMN